MRAVYAPKIPRLVVFLRDPVERIHSAYYAYEHYHGEAATVNPALRIVACVDIMHRAQLASDHDNI